MTAFCPRCGREVSHLSRDLLCTACQRRRDRRTLGLAWVAYQWRRRRPR